MAIHVIESETDSCQFLVGKHSFTIILSLPIVSLGQFWSVLFSGCTFCMDFFFIFIWFYPNFLTICTENLQSLVQFLTFSIYFLFHFFHKSFIFGQDLFKTPWNLNKDVFPKTNSKKSFSCKLDSSSKFLIKYLAFIFNFPEIFQNFGQKIIS